jgi:hypothetical protein
VKLLLSQRWHLPLFLFLFLLMACWDLGGPRPVWDEGWTLSVARNQVELGAYARLRDGQLVAHGLEAAIPFTELVALSFRLFGVGIWQGRIPGVIAGTISIGLLFWVAQQAYDRRIAWGSVIFALLIGHPLLHPLIQSRTAMAELPMVAVLLSGFFFLWYARHAWVGLPLALICFGVAALLKAQTLPFLLAGFLFGGLIALWLRQWRWVWLCISVVVATVPLRMLAQTIANAIAQPPFQADVLDGLTTLILFSPRLNERVFALEVWIGAGIPATAGMFWSLWQIKQSPRMGDVPADRLILRAILIGLAGTWMAWYLFLSASATRYMLVPTFIGSIFAAAWMRSLTDDYQVAAMVRNLTVWMRDRAAWRSSLRAWVATLLLVMSLALTIRLLATHYLFAHDTSTQQTAAFLEQLPANARIETYESALHFLLKRPYHWPPDQIHVWIIGPEEWYPRAWQEYQPLEQGIDYVVVGPFPGSEVLYRPIIDSGQVRLIQRFGAYAIYQRVE